MLEEEKVIDELDITEEEKTLLEEFSTSSLDDLSAYLLDLYEDAHRDKSTKISEELSDCVLQRNQEYDTETLEKINSTIGGSKTYHSLTAEQCRSLQDLLTDFLLRDNKLSFTIKPTSVPDLSEKNKVKVNKKVGSKIRKFFRQMGVLPEDDIIDAIKELVPEEVRLKQTEQAKKDAAIIELKLKDMLEESNLSEELRKFFADMATYPNAFLMGPLFEKKTQLVRQKVEGKIEVIEEEKEITVFKRISPFDVFPEPNIQDIQDGYVFIRSEVSKAYVEGLRSEKGYDADKIENALEDFETLGDSNEDQDLTDTDATRKDMENKTPITDDKTKLWMTTFWGKVSGEKLKSFGISVDKDGETIDDYKQYPIWSVRIGSHVVKVEFNPYPLDVIPLHTTSAYREPGNFWHTGLPKVIRPYQKVINTAVRALQNNTAFSSSSIFEINTSALVKGTELKKMKPMMVIQSSSNTANMNNRPALSAIQTPMHIESLLFEIDKISSYAGDASGISKYMSGGQVSSTGAVGRTASGMNMAMQAGSLKIKQMAGNFDNDITTEKIKILYNIILTKYNEYRELGDIKIVAGGVSSVAMKDQDSARMVELLRNISTPLLAPYVGKTGFRKIIGKITSSLGFGESQDIIPTDAESVLQEKVEEMIALQQQQQMNEQAGKSQGNQSKNSKKLQPNGSEKGKQM